MEVEKKLSLRSTSKTNCVSKTAFNQTKAGKCQRPSGPLHRNPYLNFLREFRQRNCGLSAVEIIRRGAKEWNNMAKESKLRYIEEAFYAPKKRKLPLPPPQKQEQQQWQQQQQLQQQQQRYNIEMKLTISKSNTTQYFDYDTLKQRSKF
ncbi:uncharacterized protein LOC118747091 [Rhagoletis pomonella]|uniref:uncharacterized protein LOC118747091 n=1 Tax=Rhagoletis pomonella TaxID=28610 RepID=UPI0017856679|nr:uncharacterized protein LOC118747091 [Rhagoletis pomonella]